MHDQISGVARQRILKTLEPTRIYGNHILDKIVCVIRMGVVSGTIFRIYVNQSPYEIRIIQDSWTRTHMTQHFLHYNGNKHIAVNERTVVIRWI